MLVRSILSAAIACLVLAAPHARADSYIQFGMNDPSCSYQSGNGEISFESQTDSSLTVQSRDATTHQVLDSTSLAVSGLAGSFTMPLVANLTMTSGSPNNWSASGTLTFSDMNGVVSLGTFPPSPAGPPALVANFQSTNVWLSGNATDGYQFGITGVLTPQAGDTMLVNQGSPWVFTGNTAGVADADGNPMTVTANGQDVYAGGTATFITYLTADDVVDWPITSLDDLMQYSFDSSGGKAVGKALGTPAVPEPLTLFGLAMSVGVLGSRLRKFLKHETSV